ncbi:hypothetical protein ARMGADRAFT_962876 [Armillaria gallica]|uniref:ferric-chelate reductase (NADPH) n=1 Tax=Armillaria gallica TaxID=47427 RepID=A0A2H3E8J5_ARMGA|nr:hypothetical protein ARMGADRAFT_962876 [Armillaria gallica]
MSSSFQAVNPNPTTPVYTNDEQWITAYLVIHMMSDDSRRYAYIFWFCIAAIFLVFTLFHLTRFRGGTAGAYWAKWAIRRRTWRGKLALKRNQYPVSLPPNGQLLCLALLPIVAILLCFAGPDYINPADGLFDVTNPGLSTRSYDVSQFTRWQPQYTIYKAWWTAGGRAGIIAFCLLPLCVLFALKAPPFAIFALPFTTQIHFDKLSWLHRWSGRLIYLITLLHVVFWSVQLSRDTRDLTGKHAFVYAWQYEKFLYGWVAFILMTLLVVLSIHPIRKHHYETFYIGHVAFAPLTLIFSALHHPPVAMWCWIALAIWIAERVWRGTWWVYTNGLFGRDTTSAPAIVVASPTHKAVDSECQILRPSTHPPSESYPPSPSPYLSDRYSRLSLMEPTSALRYSPPPGYAHVELLSGATVRLTYISPGFLSWAPGQHFLINVPSVSRLVSHPFTVASICDEQAPSNSGRAIVFLVRSKAGWTRDLWDYTIKLLSQGQNHPPGENPPNGTVMPKNGVLMRMFIDGPFGSAVRARWEDNATVVIFVAGSGVSFGLSILEYVCLCLAGRDGKHLGGRVGGWGRKGFATRRVRFVWLIREYGHIQWCASILRRCMSMIPSPGLDVDIFVTNSHPQIRRQPSRPKIELDSELTPPAPHFNHRPASPASSESDGDDVDLSYYAGEFGDEGDVGDVSVRRLEDYTLDLTNFDGDNETTLPGEAQLNRRVRKVGKDRRAHTRKFSQAIQMKEKLDEFARLQRQSVHSTDGLLTHGNKPTHTRNVSSESATEGDLASLKPLSPGDYNRRHSYLSTDSHLHIPSPLRPPTPTLSPLSPLSPSFNEIETVMSPSADTLESPTRDGDTDTYGQKLHLNEPEMRDLGVVAEHARPGKPRIDRILKDEVDRSNGSVIVACCGPTSFSAMVRKAISNQINPARVRKGDRRGYIDLVSEEFSY